MHRTWARVCVCPYIKDAANMQTIVHGSRARSYEYVQCTRNVYDCIGRLYYAKTLNTRIGRNGQRLNERLYGNIECWLPKNLNVFVEVIVIY